MSTRAAAHPSPLTTTKNFLEMVKFSHTIFALPFALAAMLVASDGLPPLKVVFWILIAMIAARTAAMGFNRIVDRRIDAQNPRTKNRELPSGKVTLRQAGALVLISAAVFIFAAAALNDLAFGLSFPTLGVLFFYSYCKRFTSLSHLVLGLCLGIAPVGAWVAVRERIELAPIVLGAAVMLWVAGFDAIYSTLDADFDRKAGLHSLAQRFGVRGALVLARLFHAGFIALLMGFGIVAKLGVLFPFAVLMIALFLIYEHVIVKPNDLRRVNEAFFKVNGAISVFFLATVVVAVFLKR